MLMDGGWLGPTVTGKIQITQWLTNLPREPSRMSITEVGFLSYAGYKNKDFHGFPANFWHSGLVESALPAEFLWTWCKYVKIPHVSIGYESLGGKVNAVAADETAYPHRDAVAEIVVQGLFPNASDEVAARRNSENIYKDFQRFLRGVYVNNVDNSLPDWADQYYRGNLPRLQEIKAAVNPENVFNFPQAIPLPHSAGH